MSKTKKKYRTFNGVSIFLIIVGLTLLVIGIYMKFYYPPKSNFSIQSNEPNIVLDGTLKLIIGIGLFIIGLYRIVFRKKVFGDKLRFEKERKDRGIVS